MSETLECFPVQAAPFHRRPKRRTVERDIFERRDRTLEHVVRNITDAYKSKDRGEQVNGCRFHLEIQPESGARMGWGVAAILYDEPNIQQEVVRNETWKRLICRFAAGLLAVLMVLTKLGDLG